MVVLLFMVQSGTDKIFCLSFIHTSICVYMPSST